VIKVVGERQVLPVVRDSDHLDAVRAGRGPAASASRCLISLRVSFLVSALSASKVAGGQAGRRHAAHRSKAKSTAMNVRDERRPQRARSD